MAGGTLDSHVAVPCTSSLQHRSVAFGNFSSHCNLPVSSGLAALFSCGGSDSQELQVLVRNVLWLNAESESFNEAFSYSAGGFRDS